MLFFLIFLYYVFELARKDKELAYETAKQETKRNSNIAIVLLITGGLVGLFFGGKWTVDGAIAIARVFGLSEYLISVTIIAVGTSLPEMITSVVASLKKNVDLAVGNIIGSNIFNVFWVLGLTSIIQPIRFPNFIWFDLLILLLATFLLFVFMFTNKKHELDKWEGVLFVILYVSYLLFIVIRG